MLPARTLLSQKSSYQERTVWVQSQVRFIGQQVQWTNVLNIVSEGENSSESALHFLKQSLTILARAHGLTADSVYVDMCEQHGERCSSFGVDYSGVGLLYHGQDVVQQQWLPRFEQSALAILRTQFQIANGHMSGGHFLPM